MSYCLINTNSPKKKQLSNALELLLVSNDMHCPLMRNKFFSSPPEDFKTVFPILFTILHSRKQVPIFNWCLVPLTGTFVAYNTWDTNTTSNQEPPSQHTDSRNSWIDNNGWGGGSAPQENQSRGGGRSQRPPSSKPVRKPPNSAPGLNHEKKDAPLVNGSGV